MKKNSNTKRNLVTWTAIILAYAIHGQGKQALELFDQIPNECGIEPDETAYLVALMACSHAGMVEDGLQLMQHMREKQGGATTPTLAHYNILVDILVRAGRLQEAEDAIASMSYDPTALTWMTLLGACRIHNDVERAERVSNKLLALDPSMVAAYVVLVTFSSLFLSSY